MKRNILTLFFVAIGMMVTGCLKPTGCNPEEYNGSGLNPCSPQTPCSDYPDDGVMIYWDDYNTCTAMNNYFSCHRKTLEEHTGDTLRLAGWLNLNEPYGGIYANLDYNLTWAMLTDDSSHHPDGSDGICVQSNEGIDFLDFKDKKIFILGVLCLFDTYTGDCCAVTPRLNILEVDTLNNRK